MKTRLVLRKTGEYSSAFDCIRKIVKNEGLRAFYKGYIPNSLGVIPYAGTDLAVYEVCFNLMINSNKKKMNFLFKKKKTLKHFYMKQNELVENPPVPVLLMCGMTSTICGSLVSYPFALIRTRMQAQEVPMDSSQRDTMTKLMRRIWQNEGVRGLYRGLLPNLIKIVPAVSITYVVYENVKKKLDEQNK